VIKSLNTQNKEKDHRKLKDNDKACLTMAKGAFRHQSKGISLLGISTNPQPPLQILDH
jgi:hypothetical protein